MPSPSLIHLPNASPNQRSSRRARLDVPTAAGAAAASEFMQTSDMLVQLAYALVESVTEDGSAEGTEGVGGGEHVDLCERVAAICSTSQHIQCTDDVYRVALAFFGFVPKSDAELGPYGELDGGGWRALFFDLCSAFHKDWIGWTYMGYAADNDENPNISETSRLSVQLRERPSEHPDLLRTLVSQPGPAAARDRSAWYDALAFAWHAYEEMLASYPGGDLRGLDKRDFDNIVSAIVDGEEVAKKVAAVLARVDRRPGAPGLADEAAMRIAVSRRQALTDDDWGAAAHAITEGDILDKTGPFAALWLLLKFTGAQRRTPFDGYYNADSALLELILETFFNRDGWSIQAKHVDLSDVAAEPYRGIDSLLAQEGADPYGAPALLPLTDDPTVAFSTVPELALRTGNGTLVARLFSSPSSPQLQGSALQSMRTRRETWQAIGAGFQASHELYKEDEKERVEYNKTVLELIETVMQAEYEENGLGSNSYNENLDALVRDINARTPPEDVVLKVALGLLAAKANIMQAEIENFNLAQEIAAGAVEAV